MTAFTVAIPTHNRRDTVLMAVRSALAQTRPPERVMVVADGCTDGTVQAVETLRDQRVEVLDLPKGPGFGYAHRNLALERARGEVVAWLGDDDLWLPDHLERVAEIFDACTVDIVATTAAIVGPDGAMTATGGDWRVPFLRDRLIGGENRSPSGAIAHWSDSALGIGGWRGELNGSGDMDLWRRMLLAGARPGFLSLPTVLYFKGSGRTQAPAERVAQNAAYLEALSDPKAVVRLRAEMIEAASRRDADMEAARRQNDEWVPQLNRELQAAQQEREQLRQERDRLAARLNEMERRPRL